MINATHDRCKFIGGSESNMIYMGYQTKTFLNWWESKLTGIEIESPTNPAMVAGTILEHPILDLYESIHGTEGVRDNTLIKGIARANTDYLLDDKVSDVKLSKHATKWAETNKIPIQYKRQLIHYCYVHGLQKASIIAYQSNEDLIENPFQDLTEDNLYEIEVEITQSDIYKHARILDYLEFCRDLEIYPQEG